MHDDLSSDELLDLAYRRWRIERAEGAIVANHWPPALFAHDAERVASTVDREA